MNWDLGREISRAGKLSMVRVIFLVLVSLLWFLEEDFVRFWDLVGSTPLYLILPRQALLSIANRLAGMA